MDTVAWWRAWATLSWAAGGGRVVAGKSGRPEPVGSGCKKAGTAWKAAGKSSIDISPLGRQHHSCRHCRRRRKRHCLRHQCKPTCRNVNPAISHGKCAAESQFCHLGKLRLIVNNAFQWKEKEGGLLSSSGIYKWPLQLIQFQLGETWVFLWQLGR